MARGNRNGADRVEPFGSGWDNTALLVDDAVAFRFPRKQSAVELLETEARVLPRLAPLVALRFQCPNGSELHATHFRGHSSATADCQVYGPIDARTQRIARLRAAFRAISIAWFGLDLPAEDLAREGGVAMRCVLED